MLNRCGSKKERFLSRMFNDQEKHSQKAPDEQHVQPASQRQRHGGRGRAHRRLPIASRTRARDPRASAQGHAQMLPMRWTRHTPTTAENLTHENSRSLKNNILVFSEILAHGGVCPCVFHSCNKARYCRTSSCKRLKSQGKRRMMPVLEVPPSVVPQMVVCSLSGVWILVIAGRAEQHTLAQVH
mgnify:FL=1